jgi:rubrerythrin
LQDNIKQYRSSAYYEEFYSARTSQNFKYAFNLIIAGMVDKKKFRCGTCNWKFSRNYSPQLCPYCGKATVEEDIVPPADQLVQSL